MDALAHLRPAVAHLDVAAGGVGFAAEAHDRPGDLAESVAEPGVLQPEAEADGLAGGDRRVVRRLDRVEARLGPGGAVVHHLTGSPQRTRADDVALADLPAADPDRTGEAVEDAVHGELRLVGAEAAERAAHEVVRAGGDRLDVDGGHVVRAGGMTGRPLEHLHPHGRVGTGVADGADTDGGEPAVGVAPGPVLEADRMTLGVQAEALLPRQRALHRAPEQPGGERRLGLVAHVLLAAEGTAVGHQLDDDPVGGDVEDAADVVAVVPHPLPARVDVHRAGDRVRHRQRRLRLEEGVLDALRLEHLVDGVGARLQSGVDVTAGVGAHRQDVAVGAPHRERRVGGDRRQRIGDRRQDVVLHVDQLGRRPCLLAGLGDDDGEHVSGERGAPTDGDHHRPVLVDDPDAQLAGDVGGGEHGDDSVGSRGSSGVDGDDVGTGVVSEVQGGVEHPGDTEIVDVAAIAERQLLRLVLGTGLADSTAEGDVERLALGHRLDGVEDLDVAGAAAQVGAEVRAPCRAGRGRRPSCRPATWRA